MATKIIKALVNGVVQNIEVEDITSPEQPLSYDERIDTLEDKHEVVYTNGNILVGNGTTELKEMTPEETLEHINGATVATMTSAEYEALEETNANTLYMLTDVEEDSFVDLSSYMDLTSDQTSTGIKAFSNGVNIGNASLTYDSTKSALVISFT